MSVVGVELDLPGGAVLRALAVDRRGGAVVGDGSGHQDHVGVAACERLALEVGSGRRRRRPRRRAGGWTADVRGEQRHAGAAPARLVGERDAHAARRAVADVAHGVDRLARAAGGDETCLSSSERDWREHRLGARDDLLRLGHAADADLALGELAARGPDDLDAAREQSSWFARVAGCCHIRVFIAGATRIGPSWASAASVSMSSARPWARRAIVCAVSGATTNRSARCRCGYGSAGAVVARERVEGLGGDEALGAPRRQRQDVVARAERGGG